MCSVAWCSPSISCCSGGDIGLPLAAGDDSRRPAAFAYLALQGTTHDIGHWTGLGIVQCTRCKPCYIDCCGHLPLDMSPRNSLFNEAATVKLKDVCLSWVLEVKSETATWKNDTLKRKSKTVTTRRQSSWLDIQELVWAWERSLARRNSASHWKIVD